MKKHRTTLIAVIAVGLLAAWTVGVAAQDQEAGTEAASVTGTVSGYSPVSPGTVTTADGIESTISVASSGRWTTSDARLSGDVSYTGNWLHTEAGDISIQSGVCQLTKDGGTWLGEATAYSSESLGVDMDTVILTGQGAYEGLTAYVVLDFGKAPEISGVIFPSSMPPVPERYAAE